MSVSFTHIHTETTALARIPRALHKGLQAAHTAFRSMWTSLPSRHVTSNAESPKHVSLSAFEGVLTSYQVCVWRLACPFPSIDFTRPAKVVMKLLSCADSM